MSENTCGARRPGWAKSTEPYAVRAARRILAEADALDMGDPRAMARAIGGLSVALEMLLEHIGGAES